MPKGKNFQSDNFVLSLRLKGAEAVRFWTIFDNAKQRNPYAERTDVIRELLGLAAPRLLTDADLVFFQTGEKKSSRSTVKESSDFTLMELPVEPLDAETADDSETRRKAS